MDRSCQNMWRQYKTPRASQELKQATKLGNFYDIEKSIFNDFS